MSIKEQLIGTWRLISQETEYPDGRKEHSRGLTPDGILIYDSLGNMAVQLVRSGDPIIDQLNLYSLDEVMGQYHGYFGTYEVDEASKIVYHNIIGAALIPYRGTQQVRYFELVDNRLKLFAKGTVAGDETARYLVWEKLTATYPLSE